MSLKNKKGYTINKYCKKDSILYITASLKYLLCTEDHRRYFNKPVQCKTLHKYNFHLVYRLFFINDRKLGMQRTNQPNIKQSLSLFSRQDEPFL